MAEKSLLQQIHSDYAQTTTDLSAADAQAISAFCVYAEKWLQDSGIIGLGYAPTGMALRLKTGSEIPFFSSLPPELMPTAAVNITGNSSGLKTSTGERPLDVAITGS